MPEEPSAWITFSANGPMTNAEVTIPAGTRVTHPRRAGELETRRDYRLPVGSRMEVPLFEMAHNPTISLDEVRSRRFSGLGQGPVRDIPIREARITAELDGVVFQIIPRWRPLTEQKAREGLLRLMRRRMRTQRSRYQRMLDDDLL